MGGWLLAAGAAALALAAWLGRCAADPWLGRRWLGRRWPGWLPKTRARAAFRRLRLLRDLAALIGAGCAVAALAGQPLIAGLGLGLAAGLLLLSFSRLAS